MELILAEQLLLLFLDDDKGSDRSDWGWDPGLAGAVLLDLTHAGALKEADGKLVAVAGAAPEHPVLADAYAVVHDSKKERDPGSWVGRLPSELKPLAQRLARGLVERGVLAERHHKFLGVFSTTHFPETDPEPERILRERLRAVLLTERQPTPQDAQLLGLLAPYDQIGALVPKDRRKEAKARAESISTAGETGKAVNSAIEAVQVAVMIAATSVVTTSSSGGDGGGG